MYSICPLAANPKNSARVPVALVGLGPPTRW